MFIIKEPCHTYNAQQIILRRKIYNVKKKHNKNTLKRARVKSHKVSKLGNILVVQQLFFFFIIIINRVS